MAIPIPEVVEGARALVGQHPELDRTITVARAELVDQVQTKVRVGRHSFETDEPEMAGGKGTAPTPVDFALGALASCEAVTYRYWSEILGLPIDAVSVEVRGEGTISGFLGFDDSAKAGMAKVSVGVRLRGPLPAERYEELHHAVRAHCPVLATFGNAVPVDIDLIVEDAIVVV